MAEISTRALAEMLRDAARGTPGAFADAVWRMLGNALDDKPSEFKPQPCPFCKTAHIPAEFDKPRILDRRVDIDGGNVWHVVCGARGPFKPTEAEAIAAWNSITLKTKDD